MKIYKNNFLIIILLMLVFFNAKNDKSTYPKSVEELIMPSGFNNDYVSKVLKKEPVEFIKPVLRIMKFETPLSFYKAIHNKDYNFEDELKSRIADTGRYILLSGDDDLEAIYREQSKVGNDNFTDDTDVELGNLKIASYVLTGKITHSYPIVKQEGGYFSLKVSVGFSITISNTTTGVIEYTKNISATNEEKLFVTSDGMIIKGPRNLTNRPINTLNATGEDVDLSPQYYSALHDAIGQTVNFIEEKYPLMGEVIEVKNNRITTTVSEKNGIKKDDYLFIVMVGDELKDSSGKFLGYSKNLIGAAVVESVEQNISQAKIIILADKKVKPEKSDFVISLPASSK